MKNNIQEVDMTSKVKPKNKLIITILLVSILSLILGGLFYWQYQNRAREQAKSRATEAQKTAIQTTDSSVIKRIEPKSDYDREMVSAGKKYWLENYGQDGSEIILRDRGCHAALEAIKGGVTTASLNYDGKVITEIKP